MLAGSSQVASSRDDGFVRFSIVTLEPLGGLLICLKRLLHISKFHLIDLSQILLLSCGAAQVASQDIVLNSTLKDTSSVLGV